MLENTRPKNKAAYRRKLCELQKSYSQMTNLFFATNMGPAMDRSMEFEIERLSSKIADLKEEYKKRYKEDL